MLTSFVGTFDVELGGAFLGLLAGTFLFFFGWWVSLDFRGVSFRFCFLLCFFGWRVSLGFPVVFLLFLFPFVFPFLFPLVFFLSYIRVRRWGLEW